LTRLHYQSRNKVEKKDWKIINQQRRCDFVGAIETTGTVGQAKLKNQLAWGDGVFERTKRDVLELYKQDINFNSKNKIFSSVNTELKKPSIEIISDWECEL